MQAACSRRRILAIVPGTVATLILPSPGFADTGCGAIQRLLSRIEEDHRAIPLWAVSVAPAQLRHFETQLAQLEREVAAAQRSFNSASKEKLIASINLAGSSGFLLASVALVGVAGASAGMFAASVFFVGGMLVLQSALSPQSVTGIDVVQDVGLDRIGNILSVAGDKAYAMSANSARLLGPAGSVVSFVTTAFAAAKLAQSWQRADQANQKLAELDSKAREARRVLDTLRASDALQSFRRNCLESLREDARPAAQRICSVVVPRRP